MIKDGNIRKCPNIKDEACGGDGISQNGGHGKTTELLAIYKYEVATFGQGGSGGGQVASRYRCNMQPFQHLLV